MTNAIDSQLVSLYESTNLWPMIALSNIAQGSAVLAMILLQKKNERAQQINVPACISCYLGVTEPALFGVNLKYVFPLVCGMIGSAVSAVVCTGFGVQAVSIGVGGLPESSPLFRSIGDFPDLYGSRGGDSLCADLSDGQKEAFQD